VIASLLFVLLSVTAAQPQKTLPAGKLCIGDAPCAATEGAQVRVTAAETPRRFVWISDDRSVIAAGVLARDQRELTLGEGTSRTLRVNPPVRGSVAFELSSPAGRWQWDLINPPPSLRLIHPPCAECVLSARAKGVRSFEKPLHEVVEIALHPLPKITGTVTDRATGTPLPGATITAAGILLAKSGADGSFDTSIDGNWPRAIEVGYPGRATRRVNLPRIPGDADLASIALSVGGALRVSIDPPIPQKLTWELRTPMNFELLRKGTIEAGATEVSIDGLDEGKHNFSIVGSKPLQRFGTVVQITDGSVIETPIAIEPATVKFAVRRGDAAVGGKTLHVSGPAWTGGEVTLNADGEATEEIWQRGWFYASVASGGMSSAREEIDQDEFSWRIDIPDRVVTGRVVDATTGAGLSGARVRFGVQKGDGKVVRTERTDSEGRFTFDAVHDGSHEMNVEHDAYLTAEKIQVVVDQASGVYPQEIRLRSRSDGRPLSVVDERGAPLPEALVILGDRNGLREIAFTGVDGRCVVPLGPEDSGTVFVIPRSGSFAFNRIPAQRGDDALIAMRVRAGAATINVEARDSAGKPLPNVLVVPRVNGMMLPLDLIDAFKRMQGVSLMTDAEGRARLSGMPPGVYELWAVTGQDQIRALRSAMPPPPAASLEVISGSYAVTIGFASSATVSP
jgi:hypothetical protein